MSDNNSQSESPNVSHKASRDAAMRLSMVSGIGPRTFGDLLEAFGSAQAVLEADLKSLKQVPGVGSKLASEISNAHAKVDIQQQIDLCSTNGISILTRADANYPKRLTEIYDPPNVLYTHGDVIPQDEIAIAIVGSRHATNYGLRMADRLARELSMAGFTIVSGLARGIDAAAHRGALNAGGRTLAVLGSGVLNIYPPEHADLAKEVRQCGAVLSELFPSQPPKSGAFPQRNRIVTGLSLGVVVVEAAARSGALISARLANEQGREVFAVPGQITSRMSRGCHNLIRDGATLLQSVDDVLETLGPLATPTKVEGEQTIRHPAELKLTDQEQLILRHIETAATDVDTIIHLTELPAARVLSTISVLEIRRLVRRVSGTQVIRL